MAINTLKRVSPWMVALTLCSIYIGIIFAANDFDPMAFVTLGTRFLEGDPEGTEGYDGQFVYYIATDPTGADEHIDVPAYRYQRILLPMLARVLSMGISALVPWAIMAINLSALAFGTYFMQKLLAAENANRWYALIYGLFPGLFIPVRLSLTEPLAYGLVVAAIWVERNKGVNWSAGLFALAVLTKETTALFVAGYFLWMVLEKRLKDALIFGLITSMPFAMLQLILYVQFGSFGVGSGGAMATPFEIIPFNGVWRIYTDTGLLDYFALMFIVLLPATMLPSIWGLIKSTRDILIRHVWHPFVFLLLINAGIMLFVPFSTYREFSGIFRFIVGLMICVLLYSAKRHEKRALRYSTLWIMLLPLLAG